MIDIALRFQSWIREVYRRLWPNEVGATATEYSIVVGFIAFVIVGGVGIFGTALNIHFNGLGAHLKTALGLP